jgi:hypothetical protein
VISLENLIVWLYMGKTPTWNRLVRAVFMGHAGSIPAVFPLLKEDHNKEVKKPLECDKMHTRYTFIICSYMTVKGKCRQTELVTLVIPRDQEQVKRLAP